MSAVSHSRCELSLWVSSGLDVMSCCRTPQHQRSWHQCRQAAQPCASLSSCGWCWITPERCHLTFSSLSLSLSVLLCTCTVIEVDDLRQRRFGVSQPQQQ